LILELNYSANITKSYSDTALITTRLFKLV
jgi:hypothetical protein